MQATKLTEKEKSIFHLLNETPNGFLRQHVKPSGTVCYRLMDSQRNPLMNIQMGVIDRLVSKDVLERKGFDYVLKATVDSLGYQPSNV